MKCKISLVAGSCLLVASPLLAQDTPDEDDLRTVMAAVQALQDQPEPPEGIETLPMPLDEAAWYFRPADYPAELWESGPSAAVAYSAMVDVEGKPTSCTITETTGFELLDKLTCEIVMQRGKFTPAIDQEGQPAAAPFYDRYYWRKREAPFKGDFRIHVSFTVDETGRTADCEVIERSGALDDNMARAFEREPCPGMERGSRAPFRDEEGNPIAKRVTLLMDLTVEDP